MVTNLYSSLIFCLLYQDDVWTRRTCTGTEESSRSSKDRERPRLQHHIPTPWLCTATWLSVHPSSSQIFSRQTGLGAENTHTHTEEKAALPFAAPLCSVKWPQHLSMFLSGTETFWKGTCSDKPVLQLCHSCRLQSTVNVVCSLCGGVGWRAFSCAFIRHFS